MKSRPILFSAAMVLACLREVDPKSQTRRALNPQPLDLLPMKGEGAGRRWTALTERDPAPRGKIIRCRYGEPGDQLWVRETCRARYMANLLTGEPTNALCGEYVADGAPVIDPNEFDLAWWYSRQVCPGIHMPRYACRLVLEITDVRAQRLHSISEADAVDEGVVQDRHGWRDYLRPGGLPQRTAADSYCTLWESINGAGSWAANPWVWALGFKRAS